MKVAVFSTKNYDRIFLSSANEAHRHDFTFLEPRLLRETARLAEGFDAVCVFVNDQVDAEVISILKEMNVRLIALRCAGFNNVDLQAAEEKGLKVVRVPAYSPHAVAEHTVGLMLTLNRKFHRSHSRVREGNFALEGLLGFDLHDKTVGIFGTGQIGCVTAGILKGFGCNLLAYDPNVNPECQQMGARYVSLSELYTNSDIITLHCPLLPDTYHIINGDSISQMKAGVMLVNTSRGALIDTLAVIEGLKSGKIGSLAIDVYEEEEDLFFEDLSNQVIRDDVFARLLTFPNVVVTGHQAFFTREALEKIAAVTLQNITDIEKSGSCRNEVTVERVKG
jgi:D-lactate dehydrogenase